MAVVFKHGFQANFPNDLEKYNIHIVCDQRTKATYFLNIKTLAENQNIRIDEFHNVGRGGGPFAFELTSTELVIGLACYITLKTFDGMLNELGAKLISPLFKKFSRKNFPIEITLDVQNKNIKVVAPQGISDKGAKTLMKLVDHLSQKPTKKRKTTLVYVEKDKKLVLISEED